MAFIEEQFPICPSLGAKSAPAYNVSVARMQSGAERRNRFWQYPLHRYIVSVDPRKVDEVQEVLEWWHAMGGPECGFRWIDYADYKSCRVHLDPTPLDQPIASGSGSPLTYQLMKEYTVGSRTQERIILKPVSGTIRVANGSGTEQASNLWDLDYTTGILTPLPGFSGVPATWGGEFDVPVRFEGTELPITLMQNTIHGTDFVLVELRNPD